jgi:MFS family permease
VAGADRRVVAGLALSVGAMSASTFGTLGFAALAPLERDEFGLSTFAVGSLTALVFLGALAASNPAGRLTDRAGAARTLAGSQVLLACGIAIAATAPQAWVFLAGVAVAGLAYGAVNPGTNVLVTFSVPARHRGLVMSVKQTGVTLGGLAAGAILPSVAAATSWRTALLLPLAALMVTTSGALWLGARRRAGWLAEEGRAAADERPRAPHTVPGAGPTARFGFVMAGVQLAFVGYLAVYLVDRQGFSPETAGAALAVGFTAGTVGRIAWGIASDRWFASRATALGLAAGGGAVGLAVVAAGASGWILWPALALVGFCTIGWNGVYLALVADASRVGELGRATGRMLMALYAGVVCVPPLLGLLHDVTDSWPLTWTVGCAAVAGVCAVMLAAPRRAAVAPVTPVAVRAARALTRLDEP